MNNYYNNGEMRGSIYVMGNDKVANQFYNSPVPRTLRNSNLIEDTLYNFFNKDRNMINQLSNNIPDGLTASKHIATYYGIDQVSAAAMGYKDYIPNFCEKEKIEEEFKFLHKYYQTNNYITVYVEAVRIPERYFIMRTNSYHDKIDMSYYILDEYVRRMYVEKGYCATFKIDPIGKYADRLGVIVFCTVNVLNGTVYMNPTDLIMEKKECLHRLTKNCKDCSGYVTNNNPNTFVAFSKAYIPYPDNRSKKPIYPDKNYQNDVIPTNLKLPVTFIQQNTEMG